jgi:two-component system, cell cycle sensor histidine kinase and response regulator CckA
MTPPQPSTAPSSSGPSSRTALQPVLKIVVWYLVLSVAWFLLFDQVISLFVRDQTFSGRWVGIKYASFVVLTSVVLLVALRLSLQRLQSSEQRWKLLFDAAPDAYYLHDMEAVFVDGNQAAEELTGYSKEELIGKNLLKIDLLVPQDVAKAVEALERNRRGQPGGPTSYALRKRDGSLAMIEVRTLPVQVQKQRLVLGIARDITQRQQAEERLRQSEARFSAVFRTSPTPIGISDFPDGAFIDVNEAFLETFGYARQEVIGRTATDLNLWDSLQDRADLIGTLRTYGRAQQREAKFRRKSGEVGDLLVSAELMVVGGREYLLGMLLDITGRKRLQAQLLQAQKMEAIGQLAGGVAHDFNNILAAQMLQLQLLQRRSDLDPEVLGSLQDLHKGVERAAGLTRQLLLFSRRQVMEIRRLDVDELISGLMKMLQRLLGEHIVISFTRGPESGWVDADAGMLEQVIVNLCVNARDAMPRGGTLALRTELVSACSLNAGAASEAPGRCVGITVHDTGCGMDEPTLKRIFEPFFTTKEPGKGTGLGLATVHGITKQLNGWIEVQSAPGQGATFRVFLPAKAAPVTAHCEEPVPGVCGGTETVLTVEDDPALRVLIKQSLMLAGYTVIEAADGVQARRIWEIHPEVDLLFTDVVMPGGLSGLDLVREFRGLRPSVPVLISSGYSADLPLDVGDLPAGVMFLPKPYTTTSLTAAVRRALDESRPVPRG